MSYTRKILYTSLNCLAHPISLLCITLLIVNDHFLKNNFSSWLTGKLSDLSGLFFFPFLLAVILAPLGIRRTGGLAFALTAIWFALAKTNNVANMFTADFASTLLGWHVNIVLDPTDAIALISLAPAWMLWNRYWQTTESPRRLAWLTFLVASLAAMATSFPLPSRVVRIVTVGDSIYVCCPSEVIHTQGVARSIDGGKTWQPVTEFPSEIHTAGKLPITVCVPNNQQVCYRIGNGEAVEESHDGGISWQLAWRIPPERYEFMERISQGQALLAVGKNFDRVPSDLLIARRDGLPVVIVAMGNEGLVIRGAQGAWERVAVLETKPTPLSGFIFLMPETNLWLLGALIIPCLLTLFLSGFQVRLRKRDNQTAQIPKNAFTIVCIGSIILILIGFIEALTSFGSAFIFSYIALSFLPFLSGTAGIIIGTIILILVIGPIIIMIGAMIELWSEMMRQARNPRKVSQATRRTT